MTDDHCTCTSTHGPSFSSVRSESWPAGVPSFPGTVETECGNKSTRIARRIHDRVVYQHLRLHSSGRGFCQGVTNPPWILGLESFGRTPGPFNLQNHLSGTQGVGPAVAWYARSASTGRRIRHRHEDTGSSRNASHDAFMHACE